MLMRSVMFKLAVLAFLNVALLVPLGLIWLLTTERASRRDTVLGEVAATWGQPQRIAGPVLSVPYVVVSRDQSGHETHERLVARFLPGTLDISARLDPQIRKRGIYRAPVYTARVTISGSFSKPDVERLGLSPDAIRWNEAVLSLGLTDLKSVMPDLAMSWNGRQVRAEPASDGALFPTALSAPIPELADVPDEGELPFKITLPMRGSRTLTLLPVGGRTTATFSSSWPSPGFVGAILPDDRRVDESGFNARWRVSSFGRNVPHAWRDSDILPAQAVERLERSGFGVDLVTPVDIYQQSERSVKYAVLFVLLTFVAIFLVELLQRVPVHPVQYILVGAALCVFYLLLLSLSEHLGFTFAYVTAAAATIALVGGYARAALKTRIAALQTTGVLIALYAFLYVLLQIEDYALLVGSLALFAVIAIVMFVTRRVDWYSLPALLAPPTEGGHK